MKKSYNSIIGLIILISIVLIYIYFNKKKETFQTYEQINNIKQLTNLLDSAVNQLTVSQHQDYQTLPQTEISENRQILKRPEYINIQQDITPQGLPGMNDSTIEQTPTQEVFNEESNIEQIPTKTPLEQDLNTNIKKIGKLKEVGQKLTEIPQQIQNIQENQDKEFYKQLVDLFIPERQEILKQLNEISYPDLYNRLLQYNNNDLIKIRKLLIDTLRYMKNFEDQNGRMNTIDEIVIFLENYLNTI